jgi:hypothetical protein
LSSAPTNAERPNTLRLWCLSVGLQPEILNEPRVQYNLNVGDGVGALRGIQRAQWDYELRLGAGREDLYSPQVQSEFVKLVEK